MRYALLGAGYDRRIAVALDDGPDAPDLQVRPHQKGFGAIAVVKGFVLGRALTSSAEPKSSSFSGTAEACLS